MHWFRAQARRRRRCRRPRTRRAGDGERDREGHEASHPREAYDYDDALVTAVLFTCAGQRADVVTAFREAGAVTIAADVNPLAPALYHADKRLAPPRVDDAAYVEFIAAAVAEHGVTLVVPLTDLDQLALARRRAEIDALVLLPEPEVVERTNDKWLAHCFFEEHGIDSPPTWLPEQVPDDLDSSSRQAAPRFRIAEHLPRRRSQRARLLPPLHDRPVDGAARLLGRGVLDRRLLRRRGRASTQCRGR